jgi:site-specific DNA-methyltransferase (cytosine-N4-specific)
MIKANAVHMPLQNKSVQSIITSPPYWGLRKYDVPDMVWDGDPKCEHGFEVVSHIDKRGTGGNKLNGRNPYTEGEARLNYSDGHCQKCGAWRGQLGLELTPGQYIEHLMLIMAECWRVLKDDGVCFVNLGDTYAGSGGAGGDYCLGGIKSGQPKYKQGKSNIKRKSLCLVPERFAIACQRAGWIIRNSIIWNKPNAMPSSVKDRFSVTHEKVFMMTKQGKYSFDLDAVRVAHLTAFKPFKVRVRDAKKQKSKEAPQYRASKEGTGSYQQESSVAQINPLGKNPGDMWSIPSQPYPGTHYSTFPEALVERMLLCSTKAGDTVLDPFGGSGTVGRVAIRLQRKPVLIDLGYHDQQAKRLNNVQVEI